MSINAAKWNILLTEKESLNGHVLRLDIKFPRDDTFVISTGNAFHNVWPPFCTVNTYHETCTTCQVDPGAVQQFCEQLVTPGIYGSLDQTPNKTDTKIPTSLQVF